MTENKDSFKEHIDAILGSRRILNKIVVLCEGKMILESEKNKARSPQTYKKHEQIPDSSFYSQCIPTHWCGYNIPRFFNCGGRSQVIETFFALQEHHNKEPTKSYLSPNKLFAMVDLDIEPYVIKNNYPFSDTDKIHEALYEKAQVKCLDDSHKIWTTALIHKEAYFILPHCRHVYNDMHEYPFFGETPLDITSMYREAITQIDPLSAEHERDILHNFNFIQDRLTRVGMCQNVDHSTPENLANSYKQILASCRTEEENENFSKILFFTAKAKPLWEKICLPKESASSLSNQQYQDQIISNIAKYISSLKPQEHPIAGFLDYLKERR